MLIKVTDLNEAPSLQDADFMLEENSSPGAVVGTPMNYTDPVILMMLQ